MTKKMLTRIVSLVMVFTLVLAYSPIVISHAKKNNEPLSLTIENKDGLRNMCPGDKLDITINKDSSNAKKSSLKYKSMDKDVCKVSKTGTVTAVAPGSTKIKITSAARKGVQLVLIKVKRPNINVLSFNSNKFYFEFSPSDPNEVEIPDTDTSGDENDGSNDSSDGSDDTDEGPDEGPDEDSECLWLGDDDGFNNYYILYVGKGEKKYDVSDDDEMIAKINFTSSDTSVATVDESGEVTFHKLGKTTITASSKKDPTVKATIDITCGKPLDEGEQPVYL